MLSRNDMLSTEVCRAYLTASLGQAPLDITPSQVGRSRPRQYGYVNEPAYGFFTAGSTLKGMNGVWIRRNAPSDDMQASSRETLLYYKHMASGWTLLLAEMPDATEAHAQSRRFGRSGPQNVWIFVDETGRDRFTHKGDTIVPGAGVSWRRAFLSHGAAAPHNASSLVVPQEEDEDELPWQVIAVLDWGILQQLVRALCNLALGAAPQASRSY